MTPRPAGFRIAAGLIVALTTRAPPLHGQGPDTDGARLAALRLAPPPLPVDSPGHRRFPETLGELNRRLDSLAQIPAPLDSYGRMFLEGWGLIAGVEVGLLTITLLMPSSFSGWDFEDGYVKDGLRHLEEAWTKPPVWDTDHWFHNYLGHPYGGNVYYNTVRAKGATPMQSFVFAGAMSFWWEYLLEAMAERPSIQDLVITPVAGALLGEVVHRTTIRMRRNGTSVLEKAFILVLNPTHLLRCGWGPL
jgi:hypothetical protein